ncbi:MAG: hypothetical protein WCB53_12965 [Terriglobales bacterium]
MTKMDLAPAVEIEWNTAYCNIQAVWPGMQVFRISAKTGNGMAEYVDFLAAHREPKQHSLIGAPPHS